MSQLLSTEGKQDEFFNKSPLVNLIYIQTRLINALIENVKMTFKKTKSYKD